MWGLLGKNNKRKDIFKRYLSNYTLVQTDMNPHINKRINNDEELKKECREYVAKMKIFQKKFVKYIDITLEKIKKDNENKNKKD